MTKEDDFYCVLVAGDFALLDGKERGKLIHVSKINAMIVLDEYDYYDNEYIKDYLSLEPNNRLYPTTTQFSNDVQSHTGGSGSSGA